MTEALKTEGSPVANNQQGDDTMVQMQRFFEFFKDAMHLPAIRAELAQVKAELETAKRQVEDLKIELQLEREESRCG